MQVLIRALAVLQALAANSRGTTLQELHQTLGIPVGSTHRVLATLMDENFVTRSPVNKRYFLGPAARELGEQAPQQTALLVTPHAAVAQAAKVTGETVFLTELVGARVVCVALVESRHPLRLFVRIGQEMPLHAAASARSLVAYLPEHAARKLLAQHTFEPYTRDTPSTVDAVIEHCALIRGRGYDICDDELDRNVWAVSAPVFSSTGGVAASVTMAAAGSRVRSAAARQNAIDAIVAAARALSAELGHNPEYRTTPVTKPAVPAPSPATSAPVTHPARSSQ